MNTTQTQVRSTEEALKMALEMLKDNQHLVADNERHAYVMAYNRVIKRCEEALAQPAVAEQHKQEPVALQMDVIVVNLVREGINKHRARELAEHFIKNTTLPQPKPLTDEAAMFAAQHKFLEWNRQQDGRPVKVAYEYGVFQKAIELYNEAAHGIKEKNT